MDHMGVSGKEWVLELYMKASVFFFIWPKCTKSVTIFRHVHIVLEEYGSTCFNFICVENFMGFGKQF